MGWIVIVGILLVVLALQTDEAINNWYKRLEWRQRARKALADRFESWADHNYFGSVIKEGVKVKKMAAEAKMKAEAKAAFVAALRKAAGIADFKNWVGGDGQNWWPFYLEIDSKDLHATRQLLRAHFGTWTDEIEPGECYESEGKFFLKVTYKNTNTLPYPVAIRTQYDLDNLPKGLLKDTCKVVKEEKVTVTCSVICEG